jgi:ABC-type molybdate transport system permease subunit
MARQLQLPDAQTVARIMANRPVASIALTVTLALGVHFAIRLYRQRSFFRNLVRKLHP